MGIGIGYITIQVLGCPVCDRGAIPRNLVHSNVVRSRLIILINEEINKANGLDKIVAEKKNILAKKKKKKIVAEKKNLGPPQKKSTKKKNKKKHRSELDGKQQCKIRLQDQAAHSIWSLCE